MGKWGTKYSILYIRGKEMRYFKRKLNIIRLYISMLLGRLESKFIEPEKEKEWYQTFGDNSIEEYCNRLQYMEKERIRLTKKYNDD